MRELHESLNQLFDKIEVLKKSIDHQKDTLINWREEDNALQSATAYRDEMIEDVKKLDMLVESYKRVSKQINDRI